MRAPIVLLLFASLVGCGDGGAAGAGTSGGASTGGQSSAGGASAGVSSTGQGGGVAGVGGNAGSPAAGLGGTGGGAGGAGGTGGAAGAESCDPDVYLLIDASLSIANNPAAEGSSGTKADVMLPALSDAVRAFPPEFTLSALSFGVCPPEVMFAHQQPPNPAAFDSDLAGLSFQGGTPLEDLLVELANLIALGPEPARRYAVLIADGVPSLASNCDGAGVAPVDPEPSRAAFAALASEGTKTFVIGLRNNDTNEDVQSTLATFAVAGGTQAHYDVSQGTLADVEGAIAAAFADIQARISGCE
jgi:hypothetical protein